MRTFIAARLRKRQDEDIIKALQEIEDGEISELIRKGLRMVLKIVKQEPQKQKPPNKPTTWNFPK